MPVRAERVKLGAGPKLSRICDTVVEVLVETGPLGGAELARRVSARRGAFTAPNSVYRALAVLGDRDAVLQAVTSRQYLLRDPSVELPAILLICVECGTIAQVEAGSIGKHVLEQTALARFKAHRLHLELLGRCSKCQRSAQGTVRRSVALQSQ